MQARKFNENMELVEFNKVLIQLTGDRTRALEAARHWALDRGAAIVDVQGTAESMHRRLFAASTRNVPSVEAWRQAMKDAHGVDPAEDMAATCLCEFFDDEHPIVVVGALEGIERLGAEVIEC
ncbi:MAG: hypothetical protein ACYC2E_05185 [Sulfuricella sp.]